MTDKSWMLSAGAIQKARECIQLIQGELGIKLKLSHPDFLSMIQDYVELTDSAELSEAYKDLAAFAGIEVQKAIKTTVIPINPDKVMPQNNPAQPVQSEEMVTYKGKHYPKYREGLTFKGLYRGQARYA